MKRATVYKTLVGILLMVGVTTSTPVSQAQQQKYHDNPLCDDYIRIKLDMYLNTAPAMNMDEYLGYKQELIAYCDKMIRCDNNAPGASPDASNPSSSRGSRNPSGLRSYKLDLY